MQNCLFEYWVLLQMEAVCTQGCRPVGSQFRVTQMSMNGANAHILTLDDIPAFEAVSIWPHFSMPLFISIMTIVFLSLDLRMHFVRLLLVTADLC